MHANKQQSVLSGARREKRERREVESHGGSFSVSSLSRVRVPHLEQELNFEFLLNRHRSCRVGKAYGRRLGVALMATDTERNIRTPPLTDAVT